MLAFNGVSVEHSSSCPTHTELKPSRRETQKAFDQLAAAIINDPALEEECLKNLDTIRRWIGLSQEI